MGDQLYRVQGQDKGPQMVQLFGRVSGGSHQIAAQPPRIAREVEVWNANGGETWMYPLIPRELCVRWLIPCSHGSCFLGRFIWFPNSALSKIHRKQTPHYRHLQYPLHSAELLVSVNSLPLQCGSPWEISAGILGLTHVFFLAPSLSFNPLCPNWLLGLLPLACPLPVLKRQGDKPQNVCKKHLSPDTEPWPFVVTCNFIIIIFPFPLI